MRVRLRPQGMNSNPLLFRFAFWAFEAQHFTIFPVPPQYLHLLAHRFPATTITMDDSEKRKLDDVSDDEGLEARAKKPRPLEESQSSESTLKSDGEDVESGDPDSIFESILATLPPLDQWSSATIEELRGAVNGRDPKAEWQEESEWTRRVINAILSSNEGWDWQRLKTCLNADYFSLPIQVSAHRLNSVLLHCHKIDEHIN